MASGNGASGNGWFPAIRTGNNSPVVNISLGHAIIMGIVVAAVLGLSLAFGIGGAIAGGIALSRSAGYAQLAEDASKAREDAAVAAERAESAQSRATISQLFAQQVFVELNRLGYPVQTPVEEHTVAPPEAVQEQQ